MPHIGEEITKLEKQLQDKKFLSEAPTSSVEKVRARLVKLQAKYTPVPSNKVLDEGEWGFRWERLSATEIWVTYPNLQTGSNGRGEFSRLFFFPTVKEADHAWGYINQFFTDPDMWVQTIWQRECWEEKEAEKKLYLKLKARYGTGEVE